VPTNQITGVVISGAQILVSGKASAQYEWSGNQRSETQRTTEEGLPLWRYAVTVLIGAEQLAGSIEVGSRNEPPLLPAGLVPLPADATLTVRGPRKGDYGLSISVQMSEQSIRTLATPTSTASKAA